MRKLALLAVLAVLAGCVTIIPNYPNPALNPIYGQVTLQAGFPHSVGVSAGGPIDAAILGGSCRGFITGAPSFVVNFQTIAGILPLVFAVQSSADTVLVINDPNGAWLCDDDSAGGLNPLIRVNGPRSGRYAIWVGTFGSGPQQASTLRIY